MANERETNLKVGIDASGAEAGAEKVKGAVRGMGTAVEKEAMRASAGMQKIPEATNQAEGVSKRAFNSLVSQIQRVTAQYATAGEAASQYYLTIARQKGLSAEQTAELQKYLAQLDAAKTKFDAGSGAMNNMGITAKQMQASMRGLPAQFTDIFVSLASGQPPMMVFLQQGGQIKDMFGGMVPALRGVGQLLMSLVTPWSVAAVAVGGLAYAYAQGAKEQQAFRSALIDTGNQVGATDGQLRMMAERMDALGTTQAKASAALTTFVREARIGGDQLERFAFIAVEFERVGGQAVDKTAKAFADLAKEPVKAVIKLNDAMNFLTADVYEQIRALEDAGKQTEAAKVAQEAYASALKNSTPKMVENLGSVQRAWQAIKKVSGEAVNEILRIGREPDKLAKLAEDIAGNRRLLAATGTPGVDKEKLAETTKELERQLFFMFRQREIAEQNASGEAARVRQVNALNDIYDLVNTNLSKQQKLQQELTRLNEMRIAAGLKESDELYKKAVEALKKKFAEGKEGDPFAAAREGAKEWASVMVKVGELTKTAEGQQLQLNKAQEILLGLLKDPFFQSLPENWKETAYQALYAASATLDAAEAQKKYAVERERQDRADASSLLRYAKETEALTEKAKKLEIQASALGRAAGAREELTAAEIDAQIVELESLRIASDMAGATTLQLQQIEERIEALRRLKKAMGDLGDAKEADAMRKSFDKMVDQVENSLTNSLMRGFEKGKGFLQSLIDSIRNGFKTLTVRLLIEPVMKGVATGLVSAFAPGFANAATGSAAGSAVGSFISGAIPSSIAAFGGNIGLGITNTLAGTGAFGAGGGLAIAAETGGMAGLGIGIGSVVPFIAAAYAIYSIAKSLSKGETRGGGTYGGIGSDVGLLHGPSGGEIEAKVVRESIAATTMGINSLLLAVGSAASLQAFHAGLETSEKGRGGVMSGGVLSTGAAFGESGTGSNYAGTYYEKTSTQSPDAQTALENFATDMLQVTIQALQAATDIPKTISDMLEGVDAESLTKEEATSLLQMIETVAKAVSDFRAAVESLPPPFENIKSLSFDVAASLIRFAGGLNNLTNRLGTFYQRFYSDAERLEMTSRAVGNALSQMGLSWIDTKEEFRDYITGLDLTVDAQRELYVQLLELAPAFADVADAAETAAAEAQRAADEQVKEAERLAREVIEKARQQAIAAQDMADAVWGLGGVFDQVGGLSITARTNILELAGGLDSFIQKTTGYISEYYSVQEQAAIQAASVAKTLRESGLNISGLDTKAEFRAMVDSLDLSTDTGQQQLVALLDVSSNFARLSEYLGDQGLTLEQLAAMAPVDRLAALTVDGQAQQESQFQNLALTFEGVGQSISASVADIGTIVSNAISAVVNRPIEVTVVVPSAEVNGGNI